MIALTVHVAIITTKKVVRMNILRRNWLWALRQCDFKRTRELLGESLNLRMETGDQGEMAWCLEKLAEAAHLQGRRETAVKIFGAAALRAPISSAIDLRRRR